MRRQFDPPLNYLAYRPYKGRYHLLAVWGYAYLMAGLCVEFTVIDNVTGEEVKQFPPRSRIRAESSHEFFVLLVKHMNGVLRGGPTSKWGSELDLEAAARSGRDRCRQGHPWKGNAVARKKDIVCQKCRRDVSA